MISSVSSAQSSYQMLSWHHAVAQAFVTIVRELKRERGAENSSVDFLNTNLLHLLLGIRQSMFENKESQQRMNCPSCKREQHPDNCTSNEHVRQKVNSFLREVARKQKLTVSSASSLPSLNGSSELKATDKSLVVKTDFKGLWMARAVKTTLSPFLFSIRTEPFLNQLQQNLPLYLLVSRIC